jgi:hypothetical protein
MQVMFPASFFVEKILVKQKRLAFVLPLWYYIRAWETMAASSKFHASRQMGISSAGGKLTGVQPHKIPKTQKILRWFFIARTMTKPPQPL